MKAWLLFICWIPTVGYTQSQNDPIEAVIQEINYGEDTLRAVFDWVANTIEYDVALLGMKRPYASEDEIVAQALDRKKGICQHYASLFNELVQRLGYESHVVIGYTIQEDIVNDEISHAWNAVRVRDNWYFFDPTWSSGYVDNHQFFKHYDDVWYMVPPEEFIRSHIPFDPIWQLTPHPLTHRAVQEGNFSATLDHSFSFEDSLAAQLNQDTLTNLRSSIRRINEFGLANQLIRERVDVLNQQTIIIEHNQAVATLNGVVVDFNRYIAAKNRRFRRPKMSDEELKDVSSSLTERVDAAYAAFNATVATPSLSIQQLQENRNVTENARQRIYEERAFIERYLSTWKLFRIFTY